MTERRWFFFMLLVWKKSSKPGGRLSLSPNNLSSLSLYPPSQILADESRASSPDISVGFLLVLPIRASFLASAGPSLGTLTLKMVHISVLDASGCE